jgi:hypothetical protein
MLFDAIALVVLCGMMLVPVINIVVALILGAWLGGPVGALVGLALAALISAMEKRIGDRLGWFELKTTTAEGARPHVAPQVTRARPSDWRQGARHPVLSTPVYFTEPVLPHPPMMASTVRPQSEYDTRRLN